ncbi:Putative DNA-binding domain-containing protein [Enhydrobacter aerosaccus]|uniref:Putative DNA-binding domain-containing protein n=1 Tax=Enhydrobacter aerosaccus TaxID=225324 RepID=A0A1T4S2T1_9HYPH|nr:DNA-binding domain-containing protein [Enhydrobacter aerosaccus]SKA22467.1 Putative DNA-binding domain-containing protein [Enhydrobacter aerosaccus]
MAPALRDLQKAFAAQLLGSGITIDTALPVAGDSISAAARLRVHRHHVLTSLSKALAGTYVTVERLVGEDYFKGLARSFITNELPEGPVLAEYGAAFPAFLERHPVVGQLPYLPDVARLDWALNMAFYSPTGSRLTRDHLARIPVDDLPLQCIELAAGTTLICSAYPLDRIWAATQPDAAEEPVDIGAAGVRLLVFRRPDDAGFVVLEEGEAALVAALHSSSTLEQAAVAATAANPDFDLSTAFSRVLGLGVLLHCSKDGSVTG